MESAQIFGKITVDPTAELEPLGFLAVVKNMSIEQKRDAPGPVFRWDAAPGDLLKLTVDQPQVNYIWELYCAAAGRDSGIDLPLLDARAPGALLPDAIYRFRVESRVIPGFNYNNWTFQAMDDQCIHRTVSHPVKFKTRPLAGGDDKTPAAESKH